MQKESQDDEMPYDKTSGRLLRCKYFYKQRDSFKSGRGVCVDHCRFFHGGAVCGEVCESFPAVTRLTVYRRPQVSQPLSVRS